MLLSALFLATLLVLHSFSKPTYYTAVTTFHPETEKNVGSGEVSLPQIFTGINTGESEMTYMKGLLTSRSLNRSLVSDSVVFEGEKRLLADLIFAFQPDYTSLLSWIEHLAMPSENNYTNMELERKIFYASRAISQSMQLGTTKAGFAELRFNYYHSELAGLICEQYLRQLRFYYANQKRLKTAQTINFLEVRTDSIKRKLDSVNYALAKQVDQGRFRLFARDEILPTELQSTQSILSQMYVSLYISQENARAQQQRDLPVLQVIDPPMPPYQATKSNPLLYGLLGAIGGVFLGVFLVSLPLLRQDLRYLLQEFVIKPALAQGQPPDAAADEQADATQSSSTSA